MGYLNGNKIFNTHVQRACARVRAAFRTQLTTTRRLCIKMAPIKHDVIDLSQSRVCHDETINVQMGCMQIAPAICRASGTRPSR